MRSGSKVSIEMFSGSARGFSRDTKSDSIFFRSHAGGPRPRVEFFTAHGCTWNSSTPAPGAFQGESPKLPAIFPVFTCSELVGNFGARRGSRLGIWYGSHELRVHFTSVRFIRVTIIWCTKACKFFRAQRGLRTRQGPSRLRPEDFKHASTRANLTRLPEGPRETEGPREPLGGLM